MTEAAATTGRDRGQSLQDMMIRRAPADVAARLDRLPVTWLHAAVVVLCALGLLFDVVEAALSNAPSAVFSAPPYRVAPVE